MPASPKIPRWVTTSQKTVATNPFLTLEEHRREEEGTGKSGDFFIVKAPNWGNIVAITTDGDIVMIEQFRQGSETVELEVPGGIIGPEEEPEQAITRELQEETGYALSATSKIMKLGQVTPNPAFIDNTCFTFLATDVVLTSEPSFDEYENIHVRLVPRTDVEELIRQGEICHALTICALYWLRLWE